MTLKKNKLIFPSKGLTTTESGLIHFTSESFNLLVEILERESLNKKLRSVKKK